MTDMPDWLTKDLKTYISKYWYRRTTLLVLILLILLLLLIFLSNIKVEQFTLVDWVIIIACCGVTALVWYFTTRFPKTPNGKIGFAIAIYSESKSDEQIIKTDFIATLRRILYGNDFNYHFYMFEIPQYYSKQIDSPDYASKILRESRAHFMLFGVAKTRVIDGKDVQIIDMQGIVSHRPLPSEVQRTLRVDISDVFPRFMFPREHDIFSFEFTASYVSVIATYIIARAALASGNIQYAQGLFEHLQQQLKNTPDLPAIVRIRKRIPDCLKVVYLISADSLHSSWRRTKEQKYIAEMKPYLDALHRIAPDDIDAGGLRAIYLFLANRDISGAIHEMERSQTSLNRTWLYNLAFLHAYKGNMRTAYKEYYRASKKDTVESRVILEVEDFIMWILEQEPDKKQLYFCLGCVNLFGKDDKMQASLDFAKFLEVSSQNEFIAERRIAEEHIEQIRNGSKIKLCSYVTNPQVLPDDHPSESLAS